MIIVLRKSCTEDQKKRVEGELREKGVDVASTQLGDRTAFVLEKIAFQGPKVDWAAFDGVDQVIQLKSPYPKVSLKQERRVVHVGPVAIGPGRCVVISGPCAVESEEQMVRIALKAKEAGAHILRGGAFKPRTSPYNFQGLGDAGLQILKAARDATGLPIVTEALDVRDLERVAEVADMIQIGSRNMQNYSLLKEAGQYKKPILLKRGMAATIQEWLLAAEYIAEKGNLDIVLCERGVRTFDRETRNLLDLSCVPILHDETFLPVAVDPSHATGRRDVIGPMALAAVAAGAEAVMIEVHDEPERALSDGFQAIRPAELKELIGRMRAVATGLGVVLP